MSWRRGTLLLAALLSLLACGALRRAILDEREELGLDLEIGEDRGPATEPHIVLAGAAFGFLRPIAINLLWLRMLELQERGEFLEIPALADGITRLQPRLPVVWTFNAHNLGYNVAATHPRRDRYRWVLSGIRLLRDDALRFNPRSPVIHAELARFFRVKIGEDLDTAGNEYRLRLAETFSVPPGSSAEAALFAEWKIDRDRVRLLNEALGMELDFRVPAAHALYWAERGLDEAAREAGARADASQASHLGRLRLLALLGIFDAGRPLRAPDGRGYSFLPHLEAFASAEAACRLELAAVRQAGWGRAAEESALSELQSLLALGVSYLHLHGRVEEARALLARARGDLGLEGGDLEPPGLERFVLTTFLGRPLEGAGGERLRERALDFLAGALLLAPAARSAPPEGDGAGAEALASGLLGLSRAYWRLAAREDTAPGASFEECLEGALAFRLRELEAAGHGAAGAALEAWARERAGFERATAAPARPAPWPRDLTWGAWHLELLDPLRPLEED